MKNQPTNEEYNQYVENVTPKHSCFKNSRNAFFVGGMICLIGEILRQLFLSMGFTTEIAGNMVSISLVFASVTLTALNWYKPLAKIGGAGTLVPITGFANSVAAPCVEYQTEGQVFGIGCKAFSIAGPVILYGIVSSFVVGLLFWIYEVAMLG